MNYLALGDSYTIGEDIDQNLSFPNQLSKKLDIFETKIVAKTGWTTTDLLAQIKNESLSKSYDFVSLLIGVNNQYQGKSRTLYLEELENLIQIGLSKVKNKSNFYLLTIPDYGLTPFAQTWQVYISADLNWYNQQIKNAGKKHNLKVIDITDVSNRVKSESHLLALDLLHPSSDLYSLWINEILA